MADLDTQSLRRAMGQQALRDPFGLVGQVVDEQFRVDAVIGEGGFSVVYRGYHLGLSEPLAIKCLKLPAALGSAAVESFVQRFRDEGRILYKLSQGNLHIVRSIASGMTLAPATGALLPYTVLEWLDGYSLAEELEARRRSGFTGRPLAELVAHLDSAIFAVAYAHTQGVVHRDLNPGNIFFAKTREGMKAKVLDFGLAKVVSDHSLELGPRAETLSHLQIFAPAYAAPEQMDKRIGSVSPATDVYTIALVLLEAMIDRAVISGDHLGEIMAKTLGMHRPTPRSLGVDVSDALENLFASAVDLDPKKRPADAGVFWGTLKHTLAAEGIRDSANPPSQHQRPTEPAMSPLEAFRSLPTAQAPLSFDPKAVAARAANASGRTVGGTFIMEPDPSKVAPTSGRASNFPKLASTMPLGDQAAEARRQAQEQARQASQRPGRFSSVPPPGPSSSDRLKRVLFIVLAIVIAGAGAFFLVRGLLGQ